MGIAAISIQWWAVRQGYDVRTQQTMVFTTLCFAQLVNALSVRFTYHSIFSSKIFANRRMWGAIIGTVILQVLIVQVPLLQTIFKTKSLGWDAMAAILFVVTGVVLSIEFLKFLNKRKYFKK